MAVFSLAQCLGYLVFALSIAGFLQRQDRRFKALMSLQSATYAVHFALLGNPAAMTSAAVSGVRMFASMRTRSPWVATVFVLLNIGLGLYVGHGWASIVPIVGGCVGTIAVFFFSGIPMRLLILGSTLLWLGNGILSGSIGGVMLETTSATLNIITIVRLLRARPVAVPATSSVS
ncbi:YgjV family protein [Silvimonas sp.]|uniref:YgjV family protein n=1 Tax=Silvimonas sp. TaxID=2650811 RepID=UPI0028478C43|nr:YgjV family protein [Silvimonas sp.]MDR3428131.1 YgjV family protein [Silvimonas sp.]